MRKIRSLRITLMAGICAILGVSTSAHAQFELVSGVAAGGGGNSAGGAWALTGTAGQAEAGVMAGTNWDLTGGFWGTTAFVDLEPPSITCPADVTLECSADTSEAANGSATATDNSGAEVGITFAGVSTPGCGSTVSVLRTWTATDASGNIARCDQIITVQDTTAPVLSGVPADVTVKCDAVPLPASPTATDHCSCQDVRDADPTAGDGDYVISANGQVFTVYCHDMTGTPREYLTLVNTGGNFNYGQYTAGGASVGTTVRTNYTRLRLDPSTLSVDIGDKTFSTSVGSLFHGSFNVTSMPYGVAQACVSTSNPAGTANIDLTGTPFRVADTFVTRGFIASGSVSPASVSPALPATIVNLTGGGFCGWTSMSGAPSGPHATGVSFALDLEFGGSSPSLPSVVFAEVQTGAGCANSFTLARTWTATDACGNSSSSTQTITVDPCDGDGDGVPDCIDPCPFNNPDDTDLDGVCDDDDICPGFDDNADADGDAVPDGCDNCPQGLITVCDDGDVCTDDSCDDAGNTGCVFTNNTASCNDGDACTIGDACADGICAGSAVDCSSFTDACNDGVCNASTGECEALAANDNAACDDGDACTIGDACAGGTCAGTSVDCSSLTDACNVGVCNAGTGGCEALVANDNGTCDDGDACTTGDACSAGVCVGGVPPDCDDGNVCTDDSCNPASGCVNTDNAASCNDDDACTTADTCSAGVCFGGAPPVCDDGNVCTDDFCDSASGCVNEDNIDPCDDNDACTTFDFCEAGACVGGEPPDCNDGNVCTDDSCDPASGCVNAPDPNNSCSDGNVCTDDSCDPNAECVSVSNTAACDDGNACTTFDTCSGGSCQAGTTPLDCDDGNPCTDDSCDPASGCVNTDNAATCDDGDACTTDDTCSVGVCFGGAPPDCDDGNVCTDDSCDSASGCVNTDNAASCNDDDACTTADTCSAGVCFGGTPPVCDDGNVCTDDFCDSASGCVNEDNIDPCDDNDACTTADTCANGVCFGGAPPDCDDWNVCTDDSCNPASGCVNANNTATCDDSDDCTVDDVCAAASCAGIFADADADGVCDFDDNCPNVANGDQTNSDGDSLGDACDNCALADNEDQGDADVNGVGDVCQACFAVNRAKIGTKQAKCKGIELLEVTAPDGQGEGGLIVTQILPDDDDDGDDSDGVDDDDDGINEKLKANTVVDDNVNGPQAIHTSCSQPIEIGDVFGPYTITDLLKIFNDDEEQRGNKLDIRGTFDPALPIDLDADDVTFAIDDGEGHTFEFVIPAGSFEIKGKPEKEKYKFHSPHGDELDIKAELDLLNCKFRLDAKNVQNTNQITGATLTVRLLAGANIGLETGMAIVDKKNHVEHKKKPKLECCPKCEGITRMEVTSDQGVLVFVPEAGKAKLGSKTKVNDGVNGEVKIHTSCSQPIDVGDGFGPYTITALEKFFD